MLALATIRAAMIPPAAIAAITSSTMIAVVAVTSPRSRSDVVASRSFIDSAAAHQAVRIWIWNCNMVGPFGSG